MIRGSDYVFHSNIEAIQAIGYTLWIHHTALLYHIMLYNISYHIFAKEIHMKMITEWMNEGKSTHDNYARHFRPGNHASGYIWRTWECTSGRNDIWNSQGRTFQPVGLENKHKEDIT